MPCVKHLTVYSGRAKWNVAEDVSELVEARAAGLGPEVPRMQCRVLDLRRWKAPEGEENPAVLLARLQRCEDPEALRRAAEPLRRWVGDAEHAELVSAFATWITYVRLPEIGAAGAPLSDNLEEVLEMLETQPPTWGDRMREEGRVMAVKRGVKRGVEKAGPRSAGKGSGGSGSCCCVWRGSATEGDRWVLCPCCWTGSPTRTCWRRLAEWLLVCDSGEALLSRLRQV